MPQLESDLGGVLGLGHPQRPLMRPVLICGYDYAREGTCETNLGLMARAWRHTVEQISVRVSNEDVLSVTLSCGVCICSRGADTCSSLLCTFGFVICLLSPVHLAEPHADAALGHWSVPPCLHLFLFWYGLPERGARTAGGLGDAGAQGLAQRCADTFCSFGPCYSVRHLPSIALVGLPGCPPQPGNSQLGTSSLAFYLHRADLLSASAAWLRQVLLLSFAVGSRFYCAGYLSRWLAVCLPFPDHPTPESSTGSSPNPVGLCRENCGAGPASPMARVRVRPSPPLPRPGGRAVRLRYLRQVQPRGEVQGDLIDNTGIKTPLDKNRG